MRQLAIAAVLLILSSAVLAEADPLEGRWRTAPDKQGESGTIHITICGNMLCGKLVKAYDSDGREMETGDIDKTVISKTVNKGNGKYRGKIHHLKTNTIYGSRLTLYGDTLKVKGCRLGICLDGGTWNREN